MPLTEEKVISHENKLKELKRIVYKRARHRETYKKKEHIVKEWKKLEALVEDIK